MAVMHRPLVLAQGPKNSCCATAHTLGLTDHQETVAAELLRRASNGCGIGKTKRSDCYAEM
jgi:hypothetical protein